MNTDAFLDGYKQAADTQTAKTIARIAKQTDTNPTESQTEAGNYKKGKVKVHGMAVAIENPKGSTRSGTAPDGKEWSQKMHHHYGYFTQTDGYDGDPVDIFIGPNPEEENVYVVDQVDPKTKVFDEHKVMVGFKNQAEAKKGYLANYEKGWQGLKSVTKMDVATFKDWVGKSGKKNGPKAGASKKQKIDKVAFLEGYLNKAAKDKEQPTSAEREEFHKKHGKTACSLGKKNGKFYAHTHRARSKDRDTPSDITDTEVKFINSTS